MILVGPRGSVAGADLFLCLREGQRTLYDVANSCCVACTARSPVAGLQIFGYLIAFGGVVWYNYQKLQGMRQSTPPRPVSANGSGDVEKQPLISGGGNKA